VPVRYVVAHWALVVNLNSEPQTLNLTCVPVRYGVAPWARLVPPQPWVRYNQGGYLREHGYLIMRGHYTLHGPSMAQIMAGYPEPSSLNPKS